MISEIWALFCEIAFWGWVVSAAGFLFFSFPSLGTFARKPAIRWGGAFLLFYAAWGGVMVSF